jgi:hypothetical protein
MAACKIQNIKLESKLKEISLYTWKQLRLRSQSLSKVDKCANKGGDNRPLPDHHPLWRSLETN